MDIRRTPSPLREMTPAASSLPVSTTEASTSIGKQEKHHGEHTAAMVAAGSGNETRIRAALDATAKRQRSSQSPPEGVEQQKRPRLESKGEDVETSGQTTQDVREQAASSGSVKNRPRWMDRLPTTSSSPSDQFRWRHKLVTFEKFARLREKLKLDESSEVWGELGVGDMVRMADKGWTKNIHDCTSVILTNGEKGSLGHFIPRKENLDSNAIEEAIHEDMEKLAKQGRPVSLLILGGEKDNDASEDIYKKVRNSALTAGAKIVSEIWGRKEEINTMEDTDDEDGDIESAPRMRVLFNTPKRTNYISLDGFDSIHSLKGIAYWYKHFNIASPDVFEAQGKIYTAEEANSAVSQYKSEFRPDAIVPEEELNKGDQT